ncbi:MAG: tRNA (adenosine(37)-N6)-threonylcarbamoyltransferase complex ATPase subunit type 1 TsaE [Acidobacteriota bacterium]|jgi:tRNA threonylcarbamoyladenosine biosynthesis protein TsaE
MKSTESPPSRPGEERISESSEATQEIGSDLARKIQVPGIVLLRGDLGTGKTTLTRGIARGLGLSDPTLVNSPSFTLVNIYQGRCPIYHVDLYRLKNERDLYSIGLDDFLGKDGVTIVEWSERLTYPLNQAMEIEIRDAGGDRRILLIYFPVREQKRRLSRGPGTFRKKGP